MGSMHCAQCGEIFKSWIRLQYHLGREHKKKNILSNNGLTPQDYSREWKKAHSPIEDIWKDQTGNIGY